MSNDSIYGLAEYVWTKDLSRALTVVARLKAGSIFVNSGRLDERRDPAVRWVQALRLRPRARHGRGRRLAIASALSSDHGKASNRFVPGVVDTESDAVGHAYDPIVAYQVDESSGELVVNVLGVSHRSQDWEAALSEDRGGPEAIS